ncbi:DNA-dependent RNA polymerase subunit epsilon [Salsuginibacillus kocurii]|uniref:DNA-dependent RNA polymerase subunit epsilon n=1 Tax=Salsuginibacillus kocurii TaxID=427078 RepID=UPI0003625764|nr:DNA-directed RNA polymerase subunit epsilon [Salsuginibacillus kocurii]
MIYKVFHQKNFNEVAVRENTDTIFVEADNEREVRKKLADHNYNIEYIEPLSEALLEYEKQKDDFKVENL